jgi:uncharacterized membrane protein
LIEYDRIIGHGAERIMRMAERNQEHRIYCEKKKLDTEAHLANRGQIFGFLVTLLLIGVGAWCAVIGASAVAIAIFTTTIAGVAASFVVGRKP